MYKMKGKVLKVLDKQKKDFVFKMLVLDTGNPDYPVGIQCVKDAMALVQNLTVGQDVEVEFYVNGREWEGDYFVNLKLKSVVGVQSTGTPVSNTQTTEPSVEVDQDLPF